MVPHEQPAAPKPTAGTSYDWMFIVSTPNRCTAEQTLHTLSSPDVTTTEMPASMWHILTSQVVVL